MKIRYWYEDEGGEVKAHYTEELGDEDDERFKGHLNALAKGMKGGLISFWENGKWAFFVPVSRLLRIEPVREVAVTAEQPSAGAEAMQTFDPPEPQPTARGVVANTLYKDAKHAPDYINHILDALEQEAMTPVYRERAHLLALLATHYPAYLAEGADPNTPGWPVLYLVLPTGQASWHINPDDVELFAHVRRSRVVEWDGHSTEEKYRRIRKAVEL